MGTLPTLRALVAEDWHELRRLRLSALRSEPGVFFRHYDDEAQLADEDWIALASGDEAHQIFGLFDAERLVGISAVRADRDDPRGRTVSFGMSYIAPPFRRLGLAFKLYEARLVWARARPHFERVVVGHRRSNEASRRAIERFGFRHTHDAPHRWPDGAEEDDVCYELPLRDELI